MTVTLRIPILVLLCIASASLPTLAAPTQDEIRTMIEQNRTDEALAAAREMIKANPADADARVLAANAMLRKARLVAGTDYNGTPRPIAAADADAIAAELELAIKTSPVRKDLYLGIIDVRTSAAQDQLVVSEVKRAAQLFPNDLKMMNGLLDYGYERQHRSDPTARPILDAIHQAYPKQVEAVMAWSSYLLNANDLAGSSAALEAGLRSVGDDSSLLDAAGDARTYALDFDGAAKRYSRAAAVDPKLKSVRLKWAAILGILDPKSSIVLLEQLGADVRSSGKVPTIALGGSDGKTPSRVERAASILLRAAGKASPSATEIYTTAKSLWALGLPIETLTEASLATLRDPLLVEGFMLQSEVFTRAGLDSQAAEALAKADAVFVAAKDRTFAYSHDEVLGALAASLSRAGRPEDALAVYQRSEEPDKHAFAMALLQEQLGRTEAARALFEKVAASNANLAESKAAKERLAQDRYRKQP